MIRKIIKKFKVWNDIRKCKKIAKKFGAVRYMDMASMYPSINITMKDYIYADTDSVKEVLERRIEK